MYRNEARKRDRFYGIKSDTEQDKNRARSGSARFFIASDLLQNEGLGLHLPTEEAGDGLRQFKFGFTG